MSTLLESTISDLRADIRALDEKVTELIPLKQTVPALANSIASLAQEVRHLTEWKASQNTREEGTKDENEITLRELGKIVLTRWEFYFCVCFLAAILRAEGILKLVGYIK